MMDQSPFRKLTFGVTPEMQQVYGELIFNLSNNVQIRRGDPVRKLDFEQVEANRPGTGMSDIEIAHKLGLTEVSVRIIRMLEESSRFRIDQYQKLYPLGGGKRYRVEKYTELADRFRLSDQAMSLKGSLSFDPDHVRSYVEANLWQNMTLVDWLESWSQKAGGRPLIRGKGGDISYAEAFEMAGKIAAGLVTLGLRKGDPVAIQLPNSPDYLLTYFALSLLGLVLVPLHMSYRVGDLEPLMRHARVRAVICGDAVADYDAVETMLQLREKLPDLEHVICSGIARQGVHSLHTLCGDEEVGAPLNPPVASDPLILSFTSGTSSAPKAVIATHQTALSALSGSTSELGLCEGDLILSAAPFTHMFGMMTVHWCLHAGATLLLMPQFQPDEYANILEQEKPDFVFTAPAHIATCLNEGVFDDRHFGSIRTVVFSGAVCPADLAVAFEAMLPCGKILQMYGMTEATVMSFTRPGDASDIRYGSCGKVAPGQALRIVSLHDGSVLDIGEEGEIQVRGPSVMAAYFDNQAASEKAFAEGRWFRSGDLGMLDGDGNLTVTGRIKDVINRGGVKINPLDVEGLLDRHPDILQSAIVAMPDRRLGEKACCFIVCKPGKTMILDDICSYLQRHQISKQKWPEHLVLVDEMPMTPSRKIIKSKLQIPAEEV